MKKFAEGIREHLKAAIALTAVLACAPSAGASDLTVLHAFSDTAGGRFPLAELMLGQDGRLYGTTAGGGMNSSGTLFAIKTDGSEFAVLHEFSVTALGYAPTTKLAQTHDGTIYGTAEVGGNFTHGTIFSIRADGSGPVIRHSFDSGPDGGYPRGDLIVGSDGRLYGTTFYGGHLSGGTLFSFQPVDNTFTVLRHFDLFTALRERIPGVIEGEDGRLYGTTEGGGLNGSGSGTVYAINTSGLDFGVLHYFSWPDGVIPSASLLKGADGRLYGVTTESGWYSGGTVFALERNGAGFVVLHNFLPASDGAVAQGALIQGADGTLYGAAPYGGPENYGTIFALNPDGSGFEVLHFMNGATDGSRPNAPLVLGGDGRLYGTNGSGGTGGAGTVFAVQLGTNQPPKIANPAKADGNLHVPFALRIAATHGPTSFTASGLPGWLSFNPDNGWLSGTPTEIGDFLISIGVLNAYGSDSADIVLSVGKAPATVAVRDNRHAYDGTPKTVTVTTVPEGLNTKVTYNGSTTPPSAIGNYDVVVMVEDASYEGSIASTLLINDPVTGPPLIASQAPDVVNVVLGSPLTLEVTAIGGPPLSFKWQKDGGDIEGANSSTYSVPSATPAVEGWYRVEVSSPFGFDRSNYTLVRVFEPVAFVVQPTVQTAVLGGSVTYSATATGTGPFTYQWQRNGVAISGATAATLTLTNVQAGQGANYSVVVSNAVGSVTSNSAALTIDTTPRLINVSCRGFAGVGDDTLVMGFYIAGNTDKTLLIRGIGPKLLDHEVASVVADPRITVYRDKTPLDSNDDWDAALAPEFARMGAFALDAGSKDAALVVTLAAGHSYTVHLVNNGPVAEGLIEVYDLSRDLGTRLTNASCRLNMKPGQTVILGTCLIGSDVSVLARNIGPGLAEYLHEGAGVLVDPHLRIYSGTTGIAVNDDWEVATGAWFVPAGAFGLDPGSKDAAIRVPFTPGGITVHATGKGSNGGIALIELYESP